MSAESKEAAEMGGWIDGQKPRLPTTDCALRRAGIPKRAVFQGILDERNMRRWQKEHCYPPAEILAVYTGGYVSGRPEVIFCRGKTGDPLTKWQLSWYRNRGRLPRVE